LHFLNETSKGTSDEKPDQADEEHEKAVARGDG